MAQTGFRGGDRRPKQKDKYTKPGKISKKRRNQAKNRLMSMRLAGYNV